MTDPPNRDEPGVVPLRPLRVGEILNGAFSCIRANPMATLGLAAIVMTILQLIQLLAAGLALSQLVGFSWLPPQGIGLEDIVGAIARPIAVATLYVLLHSFVVTALSGLLIAVVGQAVLGRTMRIGEAWAAVRRRLPGLIGLSLLVPLLLGLVLLAGAVPAMSLVYAEISMPVFEVLVAALLMLLVQGIVLYLGISWSLAGPAYVLEAVSVTAALRRSFRLVRKQWWRIFGIVLLCDIIAAFINNILPLPFSFVAGAVGGLPDPTDLFAGVNLPALAIESAGAIVAMTVTAPFMAGVTGLLYFDQRVRREAFDVEPARAGR